MNSSNPDLIIQHNLSNYDRVKATFSWKYCARELSGLPDGKGLNIAYEAVDRHAQKHLKNTIELRFIRKDRSTEDFNYSNLKPQSSKFANVLKKLKAKKGELVFSLTRKIPKLFVAAFLETLKYTAVIPPLFYVFGPEPINQRVSKGDATVLVTTSKLYEKNIKQLVERLPTLRYSTLTDATEHLSEKALSFSILMNQGPSDFKIPD
jgi:acetyl-CoA synthetase